MPNPVTPRPASSYPTWGTGTIIVNNVYLWQNNNKKEKRILISNSNIIGNIEKGAAAQVVHTN